MSCYCLAVPAMMITENAKAASRAQRTVSSEVPLFVGKGNALQPDISADGSTLQDGTASGSALPQVVVHACVDATLMPAGNPTRSECCCMKSVCCLRRNSASMAGQCCVT